MTMPPSASFCPPSGKCILNLPVLPKDESITPTAPSRMSVSSNLAEKGGGVPFELRSTFNPRKGCRSVCFLKSPYSNKVSTKQSQKKRTEAITNLRDDGVLIY